MAAQHHPSAETLPVIDLSPMLGGAAQDKVAVGLALREACEHTGFFYVSGHGIDPALIQRVFAQSQQFFAQPMDAKLETDKAQSKANRGRWSPACRPI